MNDASQKDAEVAEDTSRISGYKMAQESGMHAKEEEDVCARLAQVAEEELGETEEVRDCALNEMKLWLQAQPHIQNCRTDSNFLLRFLRMQKFRVEKSCAVLEKYTLMREENPGYFRGLDIRRPELEELVLSGFLFVLPERDSFGRRVIFHIPRYMDPSRHSTEDVMKVIAITLETLIEDEENQIRGLTCIVDASGLSLAHMTFENPLESRRIINLCEKSIPMRHKGINYIHLPSFVKTMFNFFKGFASKKMQNRIYIHNSLGELAERVRGVEMLPEEYGGSIPVSTMACEWKKTLDASRSRLLALDNIKWTKEARDHWLWSVFPTST